MKEERENMPNYRLQDIKRELILFRELGLRRLLRAFREIRRDRSFDRKYGTDTSRVAKLRNLKISAPSRPWGRNYQASTIVAFTRAMKRIEAPDTRTLVDLGAGKGRVMMLAAELGVPEIHGAEFSPELCDILEENLRKFREKNPVEARFHIARCDAAEYEIPPEADLFYLFNPFDEPVLERVLDNIESSVKRHPRTIDLIYLYPRCRKIIEKRQNYTLNCDILAGGLEVCIYRRAEG